MSKKVINWVVIVIVIMSVALLSIRFLWTQGESKEKARVGYLPITADISLFVAIDKGFFNEVGLEVEPIEYQTSNQVAEALIAGRIDATSVIALTVLFSVEASISEQFKVFELTIVGEGSRIHNILVRKDSNISSLKDLKGKKIGTFPGSNYLSYTKLIMKRFLDPDKDLTIVQMPPNIQIEALVSGQVDAIFTLEPTGTLAEEEGVAKVISENPLVKYIMNPFPTAASVVSTNFLKERPEDVKKLQLAIYKGIDFIRSNEEEARAVLTGYTPISESVAQKSGLYDFWKATEIDIALVQRYADLTYQEGDIEKQINVSEMFLKD